MQLPITVKLSSLHSTRGVFATQPLSVGTIVEQCPVILLPNSDKKYFGGTDLEAYILPWSEKNYSFPLGFGNLIHRSSKANVQFVPNRKDKMLNITVIKPIAVGEELIIDDLWKEKRNVHFSTQQKLPSPFINNFPFEIGESPTLHIRGIIANRDIAKNEVVIRCPVILFPMKDEENINETVLGKYYFEWSYAKDAFCLGYGALINHSFTPNVYYGRNYKTDTVIFQALEKIKKGEELFVNYNGYDEDEKNLPIDSEYVDYDHHQKDL